MQTQTPHTVTAILAQIAKISERESEAYATIDGEEYEFTAFYESDYDEDGGIDGEHRCCPITRFRVVGAYYEDGDTGAGWAGNRAELIALIGEKQVDKMEFHE